MKGGLTMLGGGEGECGGNLCMCHREQQGGRKGGYGGIKA